MSDDRIKRTTGSRLNISAPGADSDTRKDRAVDNREHTHNRDVGDTERVAMFRERFAAAKLPNIPPIPGFHTIWLSTTHNEDSIPGRLQLGYTPVQASDIPGWDKAFTLQTGEYAGAVGVQEMIAFKLPLELYEQYMMISHHERPLEEEEKLRVNLEGLKESARAKGGAVLGSEGFEQLGRGVKLPDFVSREPGLTQ